MDYEEQIQASGIVPVVVLEQPDTAVPTAQALLAGGVDVMEITFRTSAAETAIQNVVKECPQMIVGAGTILTLRQCESALAWGAKFIVSPGFDKSIVAFCIKNHITVFPGCATPSEIMQAMDMGLTIVKFFPATIYGGIKGIKALAAPFSKIKFIPTGGIGPENLEEYKMPFVFAGGGSWMCSKQDIKMGAYGKITRLCVEARKILGRE